jgi:hypothetical protein
LQILGEQVLLVDRDLTAHPRQTYQATQRRYQLVHHLRQAIAQNLLLEGLANQMRLVLCQPLHPHLLLLWGERFCVQSRVRIGRLSAQRTEYVLQLVKRQ